MEAQVTQFLNRGMNQDISVSKASNEFAFRNHNIRITAVNDKTLLSVTNEKGPSKLPVEILGKELELNKFMYHRESDTEYYYRFFLEKKCDDNVVFTMYDAEGGSSTNAISKGNSNILINLKKELADVKLETTQSATYKYYIGDAPQTNREIIKEISGNYLGGTSLGDNLIIFTKDNNYDYIYVLNVEDTVTGELKFKGDLDFSIDNPIEALSFYENENIQKVYWVDGKNYPRFINIKDPNTLVKDNKQFEFTPELKNFPTVSVEKKYSDGLFSPGVVQYFISYYNKFGSETGIVWASDLQYVSQVDRGESPDANVVCSFNININNIDTSFEYVRVYSIQRTSINSTPIARIVADTAIVGDSIVITDNNSKGESIDPSYLLFLGSGKFIASTLSQKDNTVFFGNIRTADDTVPASIRDYIKNAIKKDVDGIYNSPFITFGSKDFNVKSNSLYQLENSSLTIKTFKRGELYRFAIQFQDNTGKWTAPIWVGDKKCEETPHVEDDVISVANASFDILSHQELLAHVKSHYVNYRLLIAEASTSDRSILAQGIVSPTVFNHAERINRNGPYSIASWIIRPRRGNAQYEHLAGLGNVIKVDDDNEKLYSNTPTCEIQNSIERFPLKVKASPSSSTSPTYSRVPTVGYIISIKIMSASSVEVSMIQAYVGNLVKKTETSNGIYDNVSQVKGEDLVIVKHRETITIDQNNANDPYGYTQIAAIIYEFFNKSTTQTEIPGISLGEYNTYIRNFTSYDGMIGTTTWASGYFEEGVQFEKYKSDFNNIGLYGFATRGESGSTNNTDEDIEYSDYTSNYYVDSSIVNFFSPDIEDNQSYMSDTEYKFRIIGIAPINNTTSDIILETATPGISNFSGLDKINIDNGSNETLINDALYKDYGWKSDGTLNKTQWTRYYVYMWNKKGSVIGQTAETVDSNGEAFTSLWADLKHKVISNHRKANKVKYLTTYPNYFVTPTVFNSDVVESRALKIIDKSVIYQGNYENLVAIPSDINSSYKYKVFYQKASDINRVGGRPSGGSTSGSSSRDPHNRIYNQNNILQVDPAHIKFNTTPHAVFELKDSLGIRKILPYLSDNKEDAWDIFDYYSFVEKNDDYTYSYPWLSSGEDYSQDAISGINSKDDTTGYTLPYVFIGELYRDLDYNTLYGGNDENALERIQWIPASLSTPVSSNILMSGGDTYFQKWDCLTSYPSTEEDTNSVVDITTFMVETRINLDGRYDKNKNIINTLNARRSNFNKINPVYSQNNNFFSYSILDDKYNLNKYENQVVFSLTKEPSSNIDTWTNIPLTSAFSLNGLYGKLNKIINYNDILVAFQDKAISVINFNNRTALSTESGVPIEIANSGKVNGYTVISSAVGCENKNSICQTGSGVYFIDDTSKSVFRFNREGLNNLSTTGMSQWFRNNLTKKEYIFYDAITHDVYIVNDSDCLVYNEDLQNFTSFMDYQGMNSLFNIKGHSIVLKNEEGVSVYKMFGGKYNTTFESNIHNGYFVEYKVNPEPLIDKIFGNIEYIADSFEDTTVDNVIFKEGDTIKYPFETLEVWNEYQKGTTTIKDRFKYPNFEKKFRIWRVDIPRDDSNGRDRIRNPWSYIKLSKLPTDNYKTVFHSLLVKYYK